MCNCHLAWFSEWLKNKGLSGSPPRCAGPDRVKDVPIRELPKTEFKCTSELLVHHIQFYSNLYKSFHI